MTATVTDIRSPRHSWDKQPRKDDPTRHIRTCRRCGVKKRSEPSGGGWVELWLAEDGSSGEGKPPACSEAAQEPVPPVEVPTQPQDAAAETCPGCDTVFRLYIGGRFCSCGITAVGKARAAHLVELRSATSGMGVPTWRGGGVA